MHSKLSLGIGVFLSLTFTAVHGLYGSWHALPAGRGEILAFAADSSGQRMILCAKYAGVWLSNDGGTTWEGISSRMNDGGFVEVNHFDMADPNGDYIMSDAYDPYNAVTTHCFSGDGGESWHGSAPVSSWNSPGLAIQAWRANPELWFYLANPTSWQQPGGLFRTTNQGASWDTVSHPLTAARGFLYQDPFRDSLLYIGTTSQYGSEALVLPSTDLGRSWGSSFHLLSSGVRAMVAHQMVRLSNRNYIVLVEYTSSEEDFEWSLALSGDSTGSQFDVVQGVWDWDCPQHVIEDRTAPGTVILTGFYTGGVMRSTDYGQTWQRSLPGLPFSREFGTWLYQNPYGGALYAGVSGFGAYRSTDHGAIWQAINVPTGQTINDWCTFFTVTENAVYFAPGIPSWTSGGTGPGIFHRWELSTPFTDWMYISNIPALNDSMITLGPVLRKAGDSLFCYAGYGTAANSARRLDHTAYSADDGEHWTVGAVANDTLDAAFLKVITDNGVTRLYSRVGVYPSYPLLMSSDGGTTWERIGDFGTVPIDIAQNHDTLYVLKGDNFNYAYGVWRSTDFGQSWDSLRAVTGFPGLVLFGNDLFTLEGSYYGDVHLWRWSNGLWEDRGSIPPTPIAYMSTPELSGIPGPNPLLICNWRSADTVFYTSADSGRTWDRRRVELPFMQQSTWLNAFTWDPYRQILWALTGMGTVYTDEYQLHSKDQPVVFKPADYTVLSAYPNPFNSTTQIRFDLLKREPVKVTLYDLQGRLVRTLVDEVKEAGRHEVALNAENLASGTYFVRLWTTEATRTEKILLLK